ncbi:MAG TPA: serine/threonine-protein kinase [Kofleriaceae bacterium]|nr:serine/threonine-protein kinase [Kofleriaceae bacterium]
MTCTTCSAHVPSDASRCESCGARPSKRRDSLTGVLFHNKYQIGAKLAAGGFGSIYRAKYLPTGVSVALKVLHPDLASDPHLSARFRREAAVLARLQNPHTIKTFEHGETPDGTLYIAMELLTGQSLHAELRAQGPVPWWRMLAIMRGVCSSLIEAHSHGFVHRDLKPANIHLEERGGSADFVKVLDFGIVKVLPGSDLELDLDDDSDITRVGQAIGTLEYMAPEQIIGSETDHRTDLYTLGVVAYEMITGRRPFDDAGGATGLMTALMTRAPVPPSTMFHRDCFPAVVDQLILRCLASDPQDRFADARELADAIDDILINASPATVGMNATLPGAGPFVGRLPARRAVSLAASLAPSAMAAPAMAAISAAPTLEVVAQPAPWRGAPAARSVPPAARSVPPSPSPSPSISMSMSSPSLSAYDDGDVTTVDARPLFDFVWEPTERSGPRLARTAHLDEPPPPPSFQAARGSTVRLSPVHLVTRSQPRPQPQLAALKLAAWAAVLLASGVGLGMLVVSAMT